MESRRFFSPFPLALGACIVLSDGAARHAVRVLRLREGDGLILFDGRGGEYRACLEAVGRDRASARLLEWRDVERESPLRVTLVQALPAGDKMDFTVQKAVELGVWRIVPAAARRSVLKLAGARVERRVEHWRGVAVAACEQCGRNRVPEVEKVQNLDEWLRAPPEEKHLRILLAPGAELTLGQLAPPWPGGRVELLVGAEGGLTAEETALARASGFVAVGLGQRVLRTETAGLAALAASQVLWGDFGEGAGHV